MNSWLPIGLVFGMALVTYLPRLLPLLMLQGIKLPPFLERFLRFVPYAALGSLVFPQVFYSAGEENWLAATIATVFCVLLAWFRANVIVIVIVGIMVTYFLS